MTWSGRNTATDAAAVLGLLRERGPRTLDQLCVELASKSWNRARVERAVTVAWAQNLLSVDRDDRLVVL